MDAPRTTQRLEVVENIAATLLLLLTTKRLPLANCDLSLPLPMMDEMNVHTMAGDTVVDGTHAALLCVTSQTLRSHFAVTTRFALYVCYFADTSTRAQVVLCVVALLGEFIGTPIFSRKRNYGKVKRKAASSFFVFVDPPTSLGKRERKFFSFVLCNRYEPNCFLDEDVPPSDPTKPGDAAPIEESTNEIPNKNTQGRKQTRGFYGHVKALRKLTDKLTLI